MMFPYWEYSSKTWEPATEKINAFKQFKGFASIGMLDIFRDN